MQIESALVYGNSETLVQRLDMEKAGIPLAVSYAICGDFMISHFQKQLMGISSSDGKVEFDKAMVYALDLWVFSDKFRGVREKLALRTLKRFFQRSKGIYVQSLRKTGVAVEMSPQDISIDLPISAKTADGSLKFTERIREAKGLDQILNP